MQMGLIEAIVVGFTTLAMFGSFAAIAYILTNSPKRKNKAELEKLAKMKELGLLDYNQTRKDLTGKLTEMQSKILEHDKRIDELMEERDFYKKLTDDKAKA
jgi:hypothetical protein